MSKLTLDLASFKSSGVYTMEIDNSITEVVETDSLRLVPGFSEKPPFNRPVYLNGPDDKAKIFGSGNNSKLERRGSFFDRTLDIMLNDDPVIALNLMPIDTTSDQSTNLDKVGMLSFALSANDVSAHGEDNGKEIKNRYFEFFDRSRFWIPSTENLLQVSAQNAGCGETIDAIKTNLHKAPIFNIVNIGTSDVTVFVIKDNDVTGYNTTFANWYGNEAIPYGWIKPNDYVSDYFVKVIALKGDWTNNDTLKTDITWGKYFNNVGLIANQLNNFLRADGVSVVGTWSGIILPNFYNKAGKLVSIEPLVNNYTTQTGIMIAVNESAMENILNGENEQVYDDNFNGELDNSDDTSVNYGIDMVGHYITDNASIKLLSYGTIDSSLIISNISIDSSYNGSDISLINGKSISINDNMFVITDASNANKLNVGDFVKGSNGLARIIKKQTTKTNVSNNDSSVLCIFTCNDTLNISDSTIKVEKHAALTDSSVFEHIIPVKLSGLKITNRHRPGFDTSGNASIEAGVEKIYAMLEDEGIKRGLKNKEMISFRYIVDSMAGGIGAGLGGKLHLANLAKEVGKCTALINFPSVAQLTMSTDPLFCDNSMADSISK